MRIALVLHDASPDPDGAPLFPAVALERDGALYRVSELARVFGAGYASLEDGADFHHAVLSLAGAPLHRLDERLLSGERPSAARIQPGTFTWAPPCDPRRASLFLCAPAATGASLPAPVLQVGSARVLFGHEATVPLPPIAGGALSSEGGALAGAVRPEDLRGAALEVDAGVAVVLADDLDRATALEADDAILGYTLLLAWRPGLFAQLGSVLVTREEAGDVAALRPLFRAGGVMLPASDLRASPFTPAEVVAWLSHHVPLQAGDVVGVARVAGAGGSTGARLAFGARVELAIERLGRLCGRAVPGPEPRAWRST